MYLCILHNISTFSVQFSSVAQSCPTLFFFFGLFGSVQFSCSGVSDFVTPWTVAYQAPQSMEYSRQEYWSGFLFPSPGVFPTQGSNPGLTHCRQTLDCLSHGGLYWAVKIYNVPTYSPMYVSKSLFYRNNLICSKIYYRDYFFVPCAIQ